MSTMLDDISHLSREIGARPGGTEEERLAAMYIAEKMQKRSGLSFDIEDFELAKGKYRVFNILSLVSIILLFIAILLPVVTIPSLILTIVIAIILIMEYFDKTILSNFLKFGISQNVVAKYVPSYSSDKQQMQRKRKVVIVSHYDSGRALPGNNASFSKLKSIAFELQVLANVLIPIFLLIKSIVFPEPSGALMLFCVVMALFLAIMALLSCGLDFYQNRLLYNEGANCNASSNAALIEIARQLGTGSYSVDERAEDASTQGAPTIHGKQAAVDSGAVPKEAKIEYDKSAEISAKDLKDPVFVKEKSLQDAKAAVAAFTAPRKKRAQYDDEGNVVADSSVEETAKASEVKEDNEVVDTKSQVEFQENNVSSNVKTINGIVTEKEDNSADSNDVPDWFRSAQNKAKKKNNDSDDTTSVGQRSRFAHTMDIMAEKEEAEVKRKIEEEEEKRRKLREQIEAANKAAEEERKKKFANKEQPFFRNENDPESTTEIPVEKITEDSAKPEEQVSVEENELSLDERFRRNQMQGVSQASIDESNEFNSNTFSNSIPVRYIKEDEGEKRQATEYKTDNEYMFVPGESSPINLNEIKQYAPLDDQEFISSNEMPENDALKELPEVFKDTENIEQEPEYKEALESDIVSRNDSEIEKGKFGTGSFAAISESEGVAGATGTFAPVTETLIEDASKSGDLGSKDDMVISDADDSIYNEGQFTDTGAFAGKGYVDMPEENRKGILGLLDRKSKKSGGRHSGNIDESANLAINNGDDDNLIDSSAWEGGAFSTVAKKASQLSGNSSMNEAAFEDEAVYNSGEEFEEDSAFANAPITSEKSRVSSIVDAVPDFEEQIQDFHNASVNIEVWMVALGSEIDENAGIRSFLMEHAQELRGAIIVDIEALGAGQLSLVNSEGFLRKTKTSSRMKRFVRQAANKLGVAIPSVDINWGSSSASFASKLGYKSLRLVGMDNDAPAYYMSKDDVVEVIDENTLNQNVRYLLELIQSI